MAGGNRVLAAPSTPEEFQRRIETEIELYTKIAEANGIKAELRGALTVTRNGRTASGVVGARTTPDRATRGWRPQGSPYIDHLLQSEDDMKILYFDDFKLGVLKGDTVVDVSSVVQDIPHTGPHDLINGLIERFAEYRGRARGGGRRAARACRSPSVQHPPAAAEAGQHRLHGGQLHGRRHAHGAGADQRLPQVAERDHRPRRHHGAAGHAGHDLRRRSGARAW